MRVSLLVVASMMSLCVASKAQTGKTSEWSFAVSGDSRNCGDVVMPAIAEGAKRDHAEFYWHLGDYRAIYGPDEDFRQLHPSTTKDGYEQQAWIDFLDHQLAAFDVPVYLALGNHETTPPKTRAQALCFFASFWDASDIKAQRLADDPQNQTAQTYYHWIKGPVDFITLDNSTDDMFDDQQVAWFEAVLKRAGTNETIRSVVVGMHRALPDSFSMGHSMNDSPQETVSGRRVYQDLVDFRAKTKKNVYVLASHSHFSMGNVYNTNCRRAHPETVLPGWIVGTAGAIRYELPPNLEGADLPQNDLYGYLLGHVAPDGTIHFEFRPVPKQLTAIPDSVRKLFGDAFVQQCLKENHQSYQPAGQPTTCPQ